jgi:hypothetical protein
MSGLGWTRGGQPPAGTLDRLDYLRHILWCHTTIVNPAAVVVNILWVVIIHDEVQVHFAIWTKHGVVPLTPFVEVPH